MSIFAQAETTNNTEESPSEVTGSDSETSEMRIRLSRRSISEKTLKDSEIAHSYTRQGKFVESIELWTNIIKTNPKLDIAYNSRGYNYMQIGKLDMAIEDYNSAIKISGLSTAYGNRGTAYMNKDNFDLALTDLLI